MKRVLRSPDIAVLLAARLLERSGWTFASLGAAGLTASQVHTSIARAGVAGLCDTEDRHVNVPGLLELLEHGVRWVYFPEMGERRRGVPTAHAAPAMRALLAAPEEDVVVWPAAEGMVVGQSLEPLYPNAVRTPLTFPALYELLTLVDALRIGRRRDAAAAITAMRERLTA